MWAGSKKHNGVIGASSLYQTFHAPIGSEESYSYKTGIDNTKPYMF